MLFRKVGYCQGPILRRSSSFLNLSFLTFPLTVLFNYYYFFVVVSEKPAPVEVDSSDEEPLAKMSKKEAPTVGSSLCVHNFLLENNGQNTVIINFKQHEATLTRFSMIIHVMLLL